jgi:hypothetical protein
MTFSISKKWINRRPAWIFWFFCFGLVLARFQAHCSDLDAAKTAATNALPNFLHLENVNTHPPGWNITQTQSALGFLPSKKAVFLGEPFRTFSLSLNDVRSYNSASKAASMIKPTTKAIFPVTDGKVVLGGIDIEKFGDSWKPSRYSTTGLIQELSRAREEVSEPSSTNSEPPSLVQMKSLNYKFLGFYGTNGDLMLRPLNSYPDVELGTNTSYSAKKVLETLAPRARVYNGLPQ